MAITTSYFARLKFIDNPVAITVSTPKWYDGRSYSLLAPPALIVYSYKQKEINKNEYTKLYHEFVLDKLSPKCVYEEIISTFGNNATLLCYEKTNDFCHRHLVSEWFRNANFDVRELEF